MQSRPLPPRSLRALVFLVGAALLAAVTVAAPVDAQARPKRPIVSRLAVDEAPDFASFALADSWDFGQPGDLPAVNGLTYTGFSNISVSSGARWKGQAARGANIRLLQSWRSLPNGRDGATTPIDADRFTNISIRMRFTGRSATNAELSWYDCGRLAQECRGAMGFRVFEGWQTYDFPIALDSSRGSVDWSGDIRGLVLLPTAAGGFVEIDWIRVYEPINQPVTVTARDTNPNARLVWDRDRFPSNNTPQNPNWGVISEGRSGTFNTDAMFPGSYFIYSETDQGRSLVNQLRVNKRPRIRVLQPDARGGVDYATSVRGNAWDFSQRNDVELARNMNFTISNGELVGTNTGSQRSDSGFRVEIPDNLPINGSRFTNFSARVFYEGGFSLAGSPGGGMNARLVWRTTTGQVRVSEDIVVFPGWNTITVDLDDVPPSQLIEGGASSSAWAGNSIELFRFDPHEDSGTRRFRVDWIRLAANDAPVNGRVVIGFRDLAFEPGTVAKIYLDRNGDGVGDRLIGERTMKAGHNVYRWSVPANLRGSGEWYVTIVGIDPRSASTASTSTGTVEL